MAAYGLGVIPVFRQLVTLHHFKGPLIYARHIVPVKGLAALGGVGFFQVLIYAVVPADIDLESALHPQQGLHQAVYVIAVRLVELLRSVYEGLNGGNFPVGPLHGHTHRLFSILKKSPVEQVEGNKLLIQLRDIANFNIDAKMFHSLRPP